MRLWVGIIAAAFAAACTTTPRLGPGADPFAPHGNTTRGQAVDGLTVANRLMEAGEFELALKSYMRAAGDQGLTVDVLTGMGSANLRLGRLGQAENQLRDAIEVDQTFPPAWNNLGVVLMETNQTGEASRVFRTAFALDSGNSDEIRQNLKRALAKLEDRAYSPEKNQGDYDLIQRNQGDYRLTRTR